MSYNAGIVTAYGAAVRGGYTGTYEEFCAQQANYAASAAAVEQAKEDVEELIESIPEDYSTLSDDVEDLKDGLQEAIDDFAVPTQEAVDNWLNAHPEATTTVQDGSITEEKLNSSLKNRISDISEAVETTQNSLALGISKPALKTVHVEYRYAETVDDTLELHGAYRLAGETYYQSYFNMQGGCYNSDTGHCVLALVDKNFENVILVEIDLDSNVINRSTPLPLGHANDLTYNKRTKKIYVAPGNNGVNAGKIIVVNSTNYTVDRIIDTGYETWEISYDEINDIYYTLCANRLVVVFDNNFNQIRQTNVDFGYNGTGGNLVTQTSFAYKGEFFIQSFSEALNHPSDETTFDGIYINSFKSDGSVLSVAKYRPDTSDDEPEAICVVNDIAYIFSGHTWFKIRKLYLNTETLVEPDSDYFKVGTSISSGDDLNNYFTLGKYKCHSSIIAASLKNCPYTLSRFTLYVSNYGSGGLRQQLIGIDGNEYERLFLGGVTLWGSWRKALNTDGLITDSVVTEVPSATSTKILDVVIPTLKTAIITVMAELPSNSTGRRMISIDNVWRASCMAVSSDATRLSAAIIIRNTSNSNKTVPIRLYQNSGTALSVTLKYEMLVV